jgi:hypothetical protein
MDPTVIRVNFHMPFFYHLLYKKQESLYKPAKIIGDSVPFLNSRRVKGVYCHSSFSNTLMLIGGQLLYNTMQGKTSMGHLSIVEFYENRSVFITGATGFMGKVLVEKILRSCPGVERLYLLMRPSKGQSVDCRLR